MQRVRNAPLPYPPCRDPDDLLSEYEYLRSEHCQFAKEVDHVLYLIDKYGLCGDHIDVQLAMDNLERFI